ncbi:MAG: hypothetical protein KDI83_10905 [Gammaproteobacteria bacterium]|nr:hypothetical protein [Gammaproteobacteria bacterium]
MIENNVVQPAGRDERAYQLTELPRKRAKCLIYQALEVGVQVLLEQYSNCCMQNDRDGDLSIGLGSAVCAENEFTGACLAQAIFAACLQLRDGSAYESLAWRRYGRIVRQHHHPPEAGLIERIQGLEYTASG